jgi:hypothetical protein
MAILGSSYISVDKLATSNSMPTISGTAIFNRFDALGNPDEAIEIILNYRPYYLFEGQLGLSKSGLGDVYNWKLHVDAPLYPGTYDVEANIYRVADDQIIASDDTINELIILDPYRQYGSNPIPPKKSLAQKAAVVAGLMNSLSNMFGNSGVGGPSPSIHPVQDDQASSPLVGRGNEERSEDTMVKSKDQVVDTAPVPAPKHNFTVTDAAAASEPTEEKDVESPNMDNANTELGDANKAQQDDNANQPKALTVDEMMAQAKSEGRKVTVIDADGNVTYE